MNQLKFIQIEIERMKNCKKSGMNEKTGKKRIKNISDRIIKIDCPIA